MLSSSRYHYVLLGVVAGALLLPHLLLPLNSDNDTYQAMALAMEQGKGLPYLGSWDQNFPGVVFYHWIGIKLFGLSDLGFRLIDVLNRIVVALLCYVIARRFTGPRAAMLAVPLVCLHYLSSGLWNAGQRDGFALTWLLVALYQLTKDTISSRDAVLATISIALATFIRPTNAAFLLLAISWILKTERKLNSSLIVLLSFVCTLLVLLLPWIFHENGLREFFLAAIRFNLDVYAGERDTFSNLLDSLGVHVWFYVLALAGLIASLVTKRIDRRTKLLLGYGLIAALVIVVMGKYHIYHFEILLPVTVLFIAIAFDWVGKIVKQPHATAIVTLVAGFILFYPIGLVSQFIKYGANEASLKRLYYNLASFPDFGLRTEEDVITHLSKEGILNDTEFLLLWPGLRWRSEHAGLTRFTTTFALTMEGKHGLTEYQTRWRREIDNALLTRTPSMIVAATGPEYLFRYSRISPDSLLRTLPGITTAMSNSYSLDTTIGGYRIYRRHDATH